MATLLTGCGTGEELPEQRAARIEPTLLAVEGVTGGELKGTTASLSTLYSCRLTSDVQGREALKGVLTEVLRTLAEQTRDDHSGTMVGCSITNGSEGVATHDLGLRNPSYLSEIRQLG